MLIVNCLAAFLWNLKQALKISVSRIEMIVIQSRIDGKISQPGKTLICISTFWSLRSNIMVYWSKKDVLHYFPKNWLKRHINAFPKWLSLLKHIRLIQCNSLLCTPWCSLWSTFCRICTCSCRQWCSCPRECSYICCHKLCCTSAWWKPEQ